MSCKHKAGFNKYWLVREAGPHLKEPKTFVHFKAVARLEMYNYLPQELSKYKLSQ